MMTKRSWPPLYRHPTGAAVSLSPTYQMPSSILQGQIFRDKLSGAATFVPHSPEFVEHHQPATIGQQQFYPPHHFVHRNNSSSGNNTAVVAAAAAKLPKEYYLIGPVYKAPAATNKHQPNHHLVVFQPPLIRSQTPPPSQMSMGSSSSSFPPLQPIPHRRFLLKPSQQPFAQPPPQQTKCPCSGCPLKVRSKSLENLCSDSTTTNTSDRGTDGYYFRRRRRQARVNFKRNSYENLLDTGDAIKKNNNNNTTDRSFISIVITTASLQALSVTTEAGK